jgi:biopolymer transport protein ExbD
MRLVGRDDDFHEKGGPNLTPLIDMLFLLIIFFIVTSAFVEEEKVLAVELAKAQFAEPLTAPQSPIVINITADGAVHLGGTRVTMAELAERLRAIHGDHKGREVQIRGDRRVPFQHVVEVHGLVNEIGFRRIDYKCLAEGR